MEGVPISQSLPSLDGMVSASLRLVLEGVLVSQSLPSLDGIVSASSRLALEGVLLAQSVGSPGTSTVSSARLFSEDERLLTLDLKLARLLFLLNESLFSVGIPSSLFKG